MDQDPPTLSEIDETSKQTATAPNDLVAIPRLPEELLAEIFYEYIKLNGVGHNFGCSSYAGLSVLTCVCRRWKETADNCPKLWTKVSAWPWAPMSWMEKALDRSKSAPLTIELSVAGANSGWDTFLTKAFSNPARLESVTLKDHKSVLEKLAGLLISSAPLLYNLSLTYDGFRSDNTLVYLSENLFNNDTPRLRKLELVGCFLPWTSHLYSGLTSLTIRLRLENSDGPQPSTQQLYDILFNMPELHYLELNGISLPDTQTLSSSQVVTFPHLKGLALEGTTARVALWLARFHYPPSANVHLSCRGVDDIDVVSLTSAVAYPTRPGRQATHDAPGNIGPFKTLRISYVVASQTHSWTENVFRIEGWPMTINFADLNFPLPESPLLKISLHTPWDNGIVPPVPLFSAFPLQELNSLYIFYDFLESDDIDQLLATTASSLQTVRIQMRGQRSFIRSLASDPALNTSADSASPIVFFPNLRHLTIHSILFGRENDISEVESLTRVLELRSLRGFRLERLVLRSCPPITTTDVERLRTCVDVVDWDGSE
ncbi:hypothetical protein BKA70DRAFT_1396099 [Coprinopsis sp. MPI-PUGE-AT-0042]|nr:hypothetical protein BKA70DRAFT_1396099 [Coprinopsis sp. MPI-PUGE-AT-0042]